MTNRQNYLNHVALVDAVIDGRLSAKDAGAGMPPVVQMVFEIAGKLGRLSRGHSVQLQPNEAGLLFEIIDSAADLVFSGRTPTEPHDRIARRLSDLAFDMDEPMSWAFNLNAIRDGKQSCTAYPAMH